MNSVTNKGRLALKRYELNKRRLLFRRQTAPNEKIKQNEGKQKRLNKIDEDFDIGRSFELGTSDIKYVKGLNLHEFKSEFLLDYTGDFELNGSMVTGPVEHKTNIRFKNVDDFERYIKAKIVDFEIEDNSFTGYVYELNTPQFNKVDKSQYGRGTDF